MRLDLYFMRASLLPTPRPLLLGWSRTLGGEMTREAQGEAGEHCNHARDVARPVVFVPSFFVCAQRDRPLLKRAAENPGGREIRIED